MNGQKIVQEPDENSEWQTVGAIKKAEEGIKPGIYNIFTAREASPGEQYEGIVLHIDKNNEIFYQKTKKEYIIHHLKNFSEKLMAGRTVRIGYEGDKISLEHTEPQKQGRKLKI
ncbi:KfrB domain-containing protein [Nitrosomonas aestuarii]